MITGTLVADCETDLLKNICTTFSFCGQRERHRQRKHKRCLFSDSSPAIHSYEAFTLPALCSVQAAAAA